MKFIQLALGLLTSLSIVKALDYNFKILVTDYENYGFSFYLNSNSQLTSTDSNSRFKFTEDLILSLNDDSNKVISDTIENSILNIIETNDSSELSNWIILENDLLSFSKDLYICGNSEPYYFDTIKNDNCYDFSGTIARVDLKLNEEEIITESIVSEVPVVPITFSEIPTEPVTSEIPIEPITSEIPTEPVTSEIPTEPVTSENPIQPITPSDFISPTVPASPSDVTTSSDSGPLSPTESDTEFIIPTDLVDPSEPFLINVVISNEVQLTYKSNGSHIIFGENADGVDAVFTIDSGYLTVNGQYIVIAPNLEFRIIGSITNATYGFSLIDNVLYHDNAYLPSGTPLFKRSEPVKREVVPAELRGCLDNSGNRFVSIGNQGCDLFEVYYSQLSIEPIITESPVVPIFSETIVEPISTETFIESITSSQESIESEEPIQTEEPIEPEESITTGEPTVSETSLNPEDTADSGEPINTEIISVETEIPTTSIDPTKPFALYFIFDGESHRVQTNSSHLTVLNLINGVDAEFTIEDGYLSANDQYVAIAEAGLLKTFNDIFDGTFGWTIIDNIIYHDDSYIPSIVKRSNFGKRELVPVTFSICEAESGYVVYLGENYRCITVEYLLEQLSIDPVVTSQLTEESIISTETISPEEPIETIINTAEATGTEAIEPIETSVGILSTATQTSEVLVTITSCNEANVCTEVIETSSIEASAIITDEPISYVTQTSEVLVTITSCDGKSVCTEIIETSTSELIVPTSIENELTTYTDETTITLTICDAAQCTESIKIQKTIITTYCPLSYTTETIVIPCTTDVTYTYNECSNETDCDDYTTEIETTTYTTITITSYLVVTEEGSSTDSTSIAGVSSDVTNDVPEAIQTSQDSPKLDSTSQVGTPIGIDISQVTIPSDLINSGVMNKVGYNLIISFLAIMLPIIF
ncbi:uncharacterized protein KGF55_002267 [Candida pseudojiufengensis]|uniref:uncharacterized protein n=1 Tax=Candida pseudojiufengensis TaxID=497109 RepID=UPI002224EE76|nr:uncharacterized protein KGF55_002267 [Candida pseudojiufengensis]KAI5964325.1 hypothetical protein KGF55_002267 [Candida pseudojiufengensis]